MSYNYLSPNISTNAYPLSRSAPEPDGMQRAEWDPEVFITSQSVPDDIVSMSQSHTAFHSMHDGAMPSLPQATTQSQFPAYGVRSAPFNLGQRSNHTMVDPYLQGQSFGITPLHGQLPLQGSPINTDGSHLPELDMELTFHHSYTIAPPGCYQSSPMGSPYHAGSLVAPLSTIGPPTIVTEEATPPLRPPTPSNLHKVMKKRRLSNTSGDPVAERSELFKKDFQKVVYGEPYLTAPNTAFQPIFRLDTAPSPSVGSTWDSEGECFSTSETSVVGESIEIDANQGVQQTPEQLHPFLTASGIGKSRRWKCIYPGGDGTCAETFSRRDKGAAHINKAHLDMRPVSCSGSCGNQDCHRTFSSAAEKNSHSRDKRVRCEICNRLTSPKNLPRHQKTAKCRRSRSVRLVRDNWS